MIHTRGAVRRRLETFLAVTAVGEGAAGVWWVEAEDAVKTPYKAHSRPTKKVIWPYMSTGPRLKSPVYSRILPF